MLCKWPTIISSCTGASGFARPSPRFWWLMLTPWKLSRRRRITNGPFLGMNVMNVTMMMLWSLMTRTLTPCSPMRLTRVMIARVQTRRVRSVMWRGWKKNLWGPPVKMMMWLASAHLRPSMLPASTCACNKFSPWKFPIGNNFRIFEKTSKIISKRLWGTVSVGVPWFSLLNHPQPSCHI